MIDDDGHDDEDDHDGKCMKMYTNMYMKMMKMSM